MRMLKYDRTNLTATKPDQSNLGLLEIASADGAWVVLFATLFPHRLDAIRKFVLFNLLTSDIK
jgi:hypothetical protein